MGALACFTWKNLPRPFGWLRWPWLGWKDPSKIWVGYGNPCSKEDMDLFYGATTIILGNGNKTPFWHAPWLEGRIPKDVAPNIFEVC
jgi:hypothetical protein